MENVAEVPICVAGGITVTFPSLCMDDATHLVHTSLFGAIRVRPTNDEAKKALKEFEDAKVLVTVCGYQRQSTNCSHIDAYYVALSADFAPKLGEALATG